MGGVAAVCWLEDTKLRRVHDMHHIEVVRRLLLARMVGLDVNRKSIWRVVQ